MYQDLGLLATSLFIWGIGEGMFSQFVPIYLEDLGATPQTTGLLLGLFGIAMVISHMPAGYLADRIGRLPLLRLAWLMGILATLIMALSNNLLTFVIGNLVYSLTIFVSAPMSSYVTAARGRLSVGRALTISSAAFHMGAIGGPILGGWLGQNYGRQVAFWVACGLFVVSTLVVFQLRAQPVQAPPSGEQRATLGSILNSRYLLFLGMAFIITFCLYLPQPLTPNFLQNERGLDLVQIGMLVAGRGLGIVLLNLVLGQLNARRGFLIAQLTMAACTVLIWRGQVPAVFFLGYMLMGSYQTVRSLLAAQGRVLVDETNLGMAFGLLETVASIAIILAPPLAGLLYSIQPGLVYQVSGVLILLGFLFSLFFSPLHSKDIL